MNSFVKPLLTDLYEITMCYGYFKAGKQNEFAVFDLFFRKNPFKGEFTIFAGLSDCLRFIQNFKFVKSDIDYLKTVLPKNIEDDFYEFLLTLGCSKVKIWAIPEGTVVFPRVPLIIVEGPLGICQLLESTLLNLVNYASLITTNAARCRIAAGDECELLEFGMRRAQGPDGAVSASKYSYIGGFDGTSNVLAGQLFGIPVKGTHAHSFVGSFQNGDLKTDKFLKPKKAAAGQKGENFTNLAKNYLKELTKYLTHVVHDEINQGELAAFISYAVSFPDDFLALIDTYDVLKSGIMNFCACALALDKLGYRPLGIRVDSGDLAYLSKQVRKIFQLAGEKFSVPYFERLKIVASNDLNEDTIYSLNEQKHQVDCFAIGTHLVTCQKQPALGCVYKLVDLNGTPRIKLGEDVEKVILPGRKRCFRLHGKDGFPINDLLMLHDNDPPVLDKPVLCRHPFLAAKRAYVIPKRIERLHKIFWDQGKLPEGIESLNVIRERVKETLYNLREDIKRPLNPTPYKVSVSENLYNFLHQLWQENAPIGRLE